MDTPAKSPALPVWAEEVFADLAPLYAT